jgi:hypothetical protein
MTDIQFEILLEKIGLVMEQLQMIEQNTRTKLDPECRMAELALRRVFEGVETVLFKHGQSRLKDEIANIFSNEAKLVRADRVEVVHKPMGGFVEQRRGSNYGRRSNDLPDSEGDE